jgi:hypothetical protein
MFHKEVKHVINTEVTSVYRFIMRILAKVELSNFFE